MSGKRKNWNIRGKVQETIENLLLMTIEKLNTDLSQAKLKHEKVNSEMNQLLTTLRASSIGQMSENRNILISEISSSVTKNRQKLLSRIVPVIIL